MFLELQLHCEEERKQDNVKTKSPSPPQGSGYSGRGKTRSSLADIRLLCKAETSTINTKRFLCVCAGTS